MALQLDHLVVAAATLQQGIAWCEATLGVTPNAGGRHPLMSTHNRLFALDGATSPQAYFEIIAIDPDAPVPGRARWFDLDAPAMREAVAVEPQLVHWVARSGDVVNTMAAWAGLGLDAGRLLEASRPTPAGELRWRISVRDDGQRLLRGVLPTLIEWGAVHPTRQMEPCGVELLGLQLRGPQPLAVALAAAGGVDGVQVQAGAPALEATLGTPKGRLTLRSGV